MLNGGATIMNLSQALQFSLMQRRAAPLLYSREFSRRIMRGWAKCWRVHHLDKDRFDLAELALGNALAWRDRATWPETILRGTEYTPADAQRGRVMN
jgi:hypothetical protein